VFDVWNQFALTIVYCIEVVYKFSEQIRRVNADSKVKGHNYSIVLMIVRTSIAQVGSELVIIDTLITIVGRVCSQFWNVTDIIEKTVYCNILRSGRWRARRAYQIPMADGSGTKWLRRRRRLRLTKCANNCI